MGFTVIYRATEAISPALQREIIDATNALSQGRTWLSCEPIYFINHDGAFLGMSKPNFAPHPDDVAMAQAQGLPDGTLNDLVDILCELSDRFDIEWELSHDFSEGPVGYIRNGRCDDDARTELDAINDVAGELGQNFDLDDL